MTQDMAVLAEAACALVARHDAARGGPAAAGALQAPLTLALRADADVATRLAAFLSHRDAEAAGLRAVNVVIGSVQGDVVGRDQRKEIHHRPWGR